MTAPPHRPSTAPAPPQHRPLHRPLHCPLHCRRRRAAPLAASARAPPPRRADAPAPRHALRSSGTRPVRSYPYPYPYPCADLGHGRPGALPEPGRRLLPRRRQLRPRLRRQRRQDVREPRLARAARHNSGPGPQPTPARGLRVGRSTRHGCTPLGSTRSEVRARCRPGGAAFAPWRSLWRMEGGKGAFAPWRLEGGGRWRVARPPEGGGGWGRLCRMEACARHLPAY